MPWLEVRCQNDACPGREESHPTSCRCKGSGRLPGEDPHTYIDCPEEPDVVPARWQAHYLPSRGFDDPGDYDETIYCPSCGEEGVEDD